MEDAHRVAGESMQSSGVGGHDMRVIIGLVAALAVAGCGGSATTTSSTKWTKPMEADDPAMKPVRAQFPTDQTIRFQNLELRTIHQKDTLKGSQLDRKTVCGEVSRDGSEFRPFFYIVSGSRNGQPLPHSELLVLEKDDTGRVDRLYKLFCKDGAGLDLGEDE